LDFEILSKIDNIFPWLLLKWNILENDPILWQYIYTAAAFFFNVPEAK
jgi:hypothetical protein